MAYYMSFSNKDVLKFLPIFPLLLSLVTFTQCLQVSSSLWSPCCEGVPDSSQLLPSGSMDPGLAMQLSPQDDLSLLFLADSVFGI